MSASPKENTDDTTSSGSDNVKFRKRKVKKANSRETTLEQTDGDENESTVGVSVNTLELLAKAKSFERPSSVGVDLDVLNTFSAVDTSLSKNSSTDAKGSTASDFHEFKASNSLAKLEADKEQFIREELMRRGFSDSDAATIIRDGSNVDLASTAGSGIDNITLSLYKAIAQQLPQQIERESNHGANSVMEVSLPISTRLENLERTEKATQDWMKRRLEEVKKNQSSYHAYKQHDEDGSLADYHDATHRQRSRDYQESNQSFDGSHQDMKDRTGQQQQYQSEKDHDDYIIQHHMARIINHAQTRRDDKIARDFIQRNRK